MRFVPKTVTRKAARHSLLIQKSSPTLLFGAGIVGMVGSTVLACRATLRLEEVTEEARTKLELVKNFEREEYSESDRKHDLTVVYIKGAVAVGKLYAPAAAVGIMSVAALTKSHGILNDRVAALTAAYAAIDQGFKEYRARVVDELGPDTDRRFRHGTETIKTKDEITGDEKELLHVAGEPSIYARFFDQYSTSWSKEAEYNRIFLKCQQNYANDMLRARGHVFLNEVYDSLGLERSKAGAVVGWVMSHDSDNYIDFGIFDGEQIEDFINGREGSILLDFNVDGVIFDKIEHGSEKLSWQS